MKLLRGWVPVLVAVLMLPPVPAENRDFELNLEGCQFPQGSESVSKTVILALDCQFCLEDPAPDVLLVGNRTRLQSAYSAKNPIVATRSTRQPGPATSSPGGLFSFALARASTQPDPLFPMALRPDELLEWGPLYYRRSALGSVQGLRLTDLGTDFVSLNVVQQRRSYGSFLGSEWTRRVLDQGLKARSGLMRKVGKQSLFLELRLSF